MRVLAAQKDHPSRAVLNAAAGGLWTEDRTPRVYGSQDLSKYCQEARKEAAVTPRSEGIPACVQVFGLGVQFLVQLHTVAVPPVEVTTLTTGEILFTDGSGKYPAEPAHRRCGCGIAGENTASPIPCLAVN
eukprot:1411553-Amphidinium_carterae.2